MKLLFTLYRSAIFLIAFLFLSGIPLTAQNDNFTACNKWCARKDSLLLFSGGNNLLLIWNTAIKPENLRFKSLDRALRIGKPELAGDTTRLMAMPFPKLGKTMRLAILDKKSGKTLKILSFASDSIPVPKVHLGSIQAFEASRKELLNQVRLKLSFPGSLYNYPYEIQGYTATAQSAKGSTSITKKGFMLNKEVYQQIKDAPIGSFISFDSIRVSCPDCDSRLVPALRIKVKD